MGASSAAMLFIEWGAYEAVALISGSISSLTLAAHTIIGVTASLNYMPLLGVSVAGGIRVGQFMGERKPEMAKVAYFCSMVLGGLVVTLLAIFVFTTRNVWPMVFTNDVQVIQLVSSYISVLCLYSVFDGGQCIACGIVKGVGKPFYAALWNFVAYVIIGVPASYLLAINADLKLLGVWIGFMMAVFVAYVALTYTLATINWEKLSEIAWKRAINGLQEVDALKSGVEVELKEVKSVLVEETNVSSDESDSSKLFVISTEIEEASV
jgi:MATE family multidrug resistance protein